MAPPRRRSRPAATAATRTDRLGELLREIVDEELERIDDERLELVTITSVEVDRELDRARIFYTTLGQDERSPEVLEALAEHRGRVRRAIGSQARVRRVPEVVFSPDEAQRRGTHRGHPPRHRARRRRQRGDSGETDAPDEEG
jgi:ribosome-binding factor A